MFENIQEKRHVTIEKTSTKDSVAVHTPRSPDASNVGSFNVISVEQA